MDKQQKIVKNIRYDSGQGNTKLNDMQLKPNDECFTSMSDIWSELLKWTKKFKGKNIICPCDWDIIEDDEDIYAIRIDFTKEDIHGHINNIKSVELTKFGDNDITTQKIVNQKEIEKMMSNSLKCNFIRTIIQNNEHFKCKSITASGYNPNTKKGIKFQDIDFKEYDICVTNPPFSQYSEFMEKLISSKIDFIVLAPFLNRNSSTIGLPLFLRKAYLGYGRDLHLNFYNPCSTNKYKSKIVNVDWLVSWDTAQREIDAKHHKNGFTYDQYKDDYMVMENMLMKDGSKPIKIQSTRVIPDDYYGWMFCSVGFLDKFSYDDFEWYPTAATKYFNAHPKISPLHGKFTSKTLVSGGKKYFGGLLIKRIKKEGK